MTIAEANTLEQVCIFLGCTYARAVAAPLNQNYTADEFRYYMKDANSKLLVTGAGGNEAAEAANVVPSMSVSVVVEAGKAPKLSVTGSRKLKDASQHRDVFASDPPRADDVALFLHTSGTTSRPKGVPLSHANLIASLRNIKGTYEFTPSDVSLLVMPLFHVHGLMAGLLSPLLSGASVVLPEAGKFSAGTFWQDAVEHQVTFYTAVPTMHQILVSRADKDYPSKKPPPLRVIRSCSSSLAPATLFEVEKLFKAPVLEAYAMTEASHQMTSNPLPKFGERKPGTVGKAQGSVKVAILNEECKILGPGEVGEVCIQGPNVTKGYRKNPKANKEAFAGGWFHTGDQGYLSEDGYLTLTGRIKELINRGGEKISPLEVCGCSLSFGSVSAVDRPAIFRPPPLTVIGGLYPYRSMRRCLRTRMSGRRCPLRPPMTNMARRWRPRLSSNLAKSWRPRARTPSFPPSRSSARGRYPTSRSRSRSSSPTCCRKTPPARSSDGLWWTRSSTSAVSDGCYL